MTRNEIVNFLYEEFSYRKKDLSSIKGIIECAYTSGYIVEKIGKDEFSIRERYAIQDLTKPFIIDRTMPKDKNEWDFYNDVPITYIVSEIWFGGFFDYNLWSYMSNQQDNYYLKMEQFVPEHYDTIEEFIISLDVMTALGHFEETEENIIFHMYPKKFISGNYCQKYVNKEIGRFTPIKYN